MKVLLVQERPILSTALKLTLLAKGYDLVLSEDIAHPVSTIDKVNPGIIIADISRGGGINYVIEAKRKNLPVIVISENGDEDVLQMAFDQGANDYVSLPLSLYEVALRVSLLARPTIKAAA